MVIDISTGDGHCLALTQSEWFYNSYDVDVCTCTCMLCIKYLHVACFNIHVSKLWYAAHIQLVNVHVCMHSMYTSISRRFHLLYLAFIELGTDVQ